MEMKKTTSLIFAVVGILLSFNAKADVYIQREFGGASGNVDFYEQGSNGWYNITHHLFTTAPETHRYFSINPPPPNYLATFVFTYTNPINNTPYQFIVPSTEVNAVTGYMVYPDATGTVVLFIKKVPVSIGNYRYDFWINRI